MAGYPKFPWGFSTKMKAQRVLPQGIWAGKRILDVGCYDGANFSHPVYAGAECHGVDVDAEAIASGRRDFNLKVAPAECLPYPDGYFDLVISKLALPYTDIPKALRECHRVLKPRGELLLMMHDWRMQWAWFKEAGWKYRLYHSYICAASLIYLTTGRVIALNGKRETFQTQSSVSRDLSRAGFVSVRQERTSKDWIITARRP